ncbi:hypothetical protein [Paenibacillus tyrfis]|uniref:hypothetical protein n=1 Tax=Paenibacillus tyrfis TaxID=1501230 RepID=UPI0020A1FB0E|nr:hypothetical protein [Paenibacillus tyrfis]MCP1312129.1 hypothetical protein [Paenibacillus tyrfis]
MKLTQEQIKAMRLMAEGLGALSRLWTDELGEALSDAGLLPFRSLDEAEAEYFYIAETGEITN